VAGAADPDPRIARFDVPLSYSTIPISFDADYATAGEFLWQLRELPTVIEIRSLDVKPATQAAPSADGGNPAARGDGTITVSLTLFAYARQGRSPDVSPAAGGGR
jgi:hypothetical protein